MDEKLSNLEQAICVASIMGSLLNMYDVNKINSNINQVKRDINTLIRKRAKSNRKEFVRAITVGDRVWGDAIKNYKGVKIEVLTGCMKLYNIYETELNKFANISNKKIEKMLLGVDAMIDFDVESSSYAVFDFIIDELYKYTGKRKLSIRERITYSVAS